MPRKTRDGALSGTQFKEPPRAASISGRCWLRAPAASKGSELCSHVARARCRQHNQGHGDLACQRQVQGGDLRGNRDCTRTPTHDCLGCRDRRNAFCRRVCLAVRDQAGSASAHKRETPRRAKRAQTPPAHAAAAGCPSRPCSCARFGARPSRPGALNRRAATRRAWPLRSASWSQRASRLTAAARATLRASPARSLGIAPLCGRLQRIHDAP